MAVAGTGLYAIQGAVGAGFMYLGAALIVWLVVVVVAMLMP
jgi:hypothetical protein